MKRVIDLLLGSLLLILLSPVFAATALTVRLTMGPPVLFRQLRPGLREKPFYLCKFRTMSGVVDEEGRPLPDDQRITPLGRRLRKYSLDELPQLFNVLKGEMSLVGPRPLLMEYLPLYTQEQARRHQVKPGITGWAQVNGRNAITWEEKFVLDVWYVDNRSLRLDIKILFMTLFKVIRAEGINRDGDQAMPRYRGAAQ